MRAILIIAMLLSASPVTAETVANAQKLLPILSGLKRFEQVALTTADLGRSVDFYKTEVGLPLLFETNGMAFFDVGGVRLMIATDKERSTTPRPQAILYFQVTDFGEAVQRLREKSVKLVGPVETVQANENGQLKLQQFEDPDGNALAVMGLVPER